MLVAIALSPSAPVLVPELAGSAAAEVAAVRSAALRAAASLPDRWIAVGVGTDDQVFEPPASGTFAGYGADVAVALCPDAGEVRTELPLCALFAGWLRGQVNPDAVVRVRVHAAGTSAAVALDRGRALRAEIERFDGEVGVLIVADGANTLTPAAPGGYDPAAEAVQQALDDALASADTAFLALLGDDVVGRVAYQVLAGLAEGQPWSASELARSAPYGVGYFAGLWTPP